MSGRNAPPAPDTGRRPRVGLVLVLAGILVVAPAALGFWLLGDDDVDSTQPDPMGGGMSPQADLAATGTTADVGRFAEIQASAITLEHDAAAGTTTLRVSTSIEAVCAVAYGTGPEFGALATDTDMAGTGHSDHAAVMRGLVPGTQYTYRLQGIGPDGRVYLTEAMQFTFDAEGSGPAPATSALRSGTEPPGENVAIGAAVVDVSSEFSDRFSAGNAVDGDLGTEWSSAGDGDGAYIVVDLGERFIVSGVGFRTREMSDGTSITTSFTVTADGDRYGPFQAGSGLAVALAEFVAREIRIDVETSTGGNTGAVEIEVYGEPLVLPDDDGM